MIRRSTRPPERFNRQGLLAVDPRAFFELFAVPMSRANEQHGDVAVIEVSGPLVQRDELWCDSYEAIRLRMVEACASDARAIVIRFDSPGGDASGCFETARALREDAERARKPLVAYIDKACSAAYALASAAHIVVIGESCCAGSIGVLSSRPDLTAQNTQRGVRMAFVVSGARKLDGNPDSPITDDELEQTQRHVDELAAKFFALVGDMRPAQLTAAAVAAFDGGVFYGGGAVNAGLADMVATFDEALALASRSDAMTIPQLQAKSDYDSARALLGKVAKGNDANAAAAKRALASMSEAEPPPKDDEPDGDEPASEEDEDKKPDAEGDDDKPDAEGDDDKPAAASTAAEDEPPADDTKKKSAASAAGGAPAARSSTELELAARVHKLEAAAAAEHDTRVRAQLMARRPDFGPELRAALAKAPLSTVREMVKTLPKGKVAKPVPITTVAAARGSTTATLASSSENEELDRRMGLRSSKFGCRREGTSMLFGLVAEEEVKS